MFADGSNLLAAESSSSHVEEHDPPPGLKAHGRMCCHQTLEDRGLLAPGPRSKSGLWPRLHCLHEDAAATRVRGAEPERKTCPTRPDLRTNFIPHPAVGSEETATIHRLADICRFRSCT
ncbi:hypothetical protein AGIG_G4145 [Arapaima gigas]